eukprot:scaffold24600_cov34-Phaeocystis_antarctica.AAC.1
MAAQRVCTRRGKYTQEAVRRLHAEKGVHVCVACAAQRMAEARVEAKGAAEREAAAEALEEARAAARQVKPGVGAEATGALAAQEQGRRSAVRRRHKSPSWETWKRQARSGRRAARWRRHHWT